MTIVFPSTKSVKDEIRDAIGQTVTFIIESDTPTACPVCSGADLYDGVNEASLNPFCTTCDGKYWMDYEVSSSVVAHVRWRRQDEPDMTSGGEVFEGDCSITIDIDDLSESDIPKIKEVRADSRKLRVYRTIYRGVPTRDRIRFICKEWDKV
jgi:hypothetical protein